MELQFDFADAALRWLTSSGLTIVVVLILTLVAAGIAGILTNRLRDMIKDRVDSEERQKRINTLFAIVRTTVRAVLLVLGCIMILSELGVDLAPILATVGILGLAVSFGAQSLVKDIISGIFILIENRIRVGDVIKVDSVAGLVESINIRTIILRDLQGQMHVVPNGKVEVFSNLTKEFSRSVLDIGVSYREDVDRVMDVLRELAEEISKDEEYREDFIREEDTEPISVLGVDAFADSAVVIRMVINTKPARQWNITRELRRRIKNRFDSENIEIPFPHLTVYWGEPNVGKQQGLDVRKVEEIRKSGTGSGKKSAKK